MPVGVRKISQSSSILSSFLNNFRKPSAKTSNLENGYRWLSGSKASVYDEHNVKK